MCRCDYFHFDDESVASSCMLPKIGGHEGPDLPRALVIERLLESHKAAVFCRAYAYTQDARNICILKHTALPAVGCGMRTCGRCQGTTSVDLALGRLWAKGIQTAMLTTWFVVRYYLLS